MQRQTQAYIYAAAAVLLWSTVASAFKISLRYLSSEELLFYASFTSLVVLSCIVVTTGRMADLRAWPAREYLRSALLGFLNPFLYYLVVFKAYSLLPAQEAQPLNFIWPIVLVLASVVILRQPITTRTLVAMFVCFCGVLVISTRGDVLGFRITNVQGVLLATGSSLVWAIYWVYGTRDTHDAISRLALNFVFGFLFVAVYMLITGKLREPVIPGLLGAAYAGMFEMGITFVVWLRALRLSRTTAQVTSLIYFTPFFSLVVISVVVGERILSSTMVGAVLIVGGILIQHYGGKLFISRQ